MYFDKEVRIEFWRLNMAKIEWNECMYIGITEIDSQHETFISIFNVVIDCIEQSKSSELLLQSFAKLKEYSEFHFFYEENLMEDISYYRVNQHIKAHRDFIVAITNYERQLSSDLEIEPIEQLHYIRNWLVSHIYNFDKQLSSLLLMKKTA